MISIIIPTKNEGNYIKQTLLAIKRYKDCEVIISDGNSSDETIAIAKQHADQVLVYKGKERQTIAAGRNLGASKAQREFLVFLDADVEVPYPDTFFEQALEMFERDADLLALTVAVRVHPDREKMMDRLVFGSAASLYVLLNNTLGIGASPGEFQMIRASAFKSVGGYREDLVAVEDHDMFYRLSRKGKTRMHKDLHVYHTGRRARNVGWPKLLWQWTINCTAYILFNRSVSKEWKVVR